MLRRPMRWPTEFRPISCRRNDVEPLGRVDNQTLSYLGVIGISETLSKNKVKARWARII